MRYHVKTDDNNKATAENVFADRSLRASLSLKEKNPAGETQRSSVGGKEQLSAYIKSLCWQKKNQLKSSISGNLQEHLTSRAL